MFDIYLEVLEFLSFEANYSYGYTFIVVFSRFDMLRNWSGIITHY